jgi:hypothetical protein
LCVPYVSKQKCTQTSLTVFPSTGVKIDSVPDTKVIFVYYSVQMIFKFRNSEIFLNFKFVQKGTYTEKPVYNGLTRDRVLSFAGRFRLIQVIESWILGSPDRPDCKTFPLMPGFLHAHDLFVTPFRVLFSITAVILRITSNVIVTTNMKLT